MHSIRFVSGLIAAALSASSAAHSPYLLPNLFDVTDRDHVSIQASFTEKFFVSDIAMKAPGYSVVQPDGVMLPLAPVYTKDLAVLDVDTKLPGTYRISTGLREGATRKAVFKDGQWEFFESREAPAGAVDMQSWTRADVYVSRGAPTDAALKLLGQGLEFKLLGHPNRLHAGSTLRAQLLFDGKPQANQLVAVQAVAGFGDSVAPRELRSDAQGQVELRFDTVGLYHVMSRYRTGPVTPEKSGKSHTMALTLEVTE